MRCVILQPSFVPWRGYFDLIHRADVFVFYDDVQYDARGWRNRNRIKTRDGSRWLTIPVLRHGAQTERIPINRIEIDSSKDWTRKHLATLQHSYAGAPFFAASGEWLKGLYDHPSRLLADHTIDTTVQIASRLGISSTRFLRSSELGVTGVKTDRLVAICTKVGASEYLSGPSAAGYIEPQKFASAGIRLDYIQYDYPEYPQLFPPFDPHVSILDLLFMTGAEAPKYIWGDRT